MAALPPSMPPVFDFEMDSTVLGDNVKRYFNWVEIDSPPASDAKALLPFFLGILAVVALLLWWWLG